MNYMPIWMKTLYCFHNKEKIPFNKLIMYYPQSYGIWYIGHINDHNNHEKRSVQGFINGLLGKNIIY
jgi:hypothetical protein